jgi:hypothetical protein
VKLVNVSVLLGVAAKRAQKGLIDPLAHLKRVRVYLYRGTKDGCYNPPSVNHNHTAEGLL